MAAGSSRGERGSSPRRGRRARRESVTRQAGLAGGSGLRAVRGADLAPLTTLAAGGPARLLLDVEDPGRLGDALGMAAAEDRPLLVLGGGSNVVVAEAGFDGTVLRFLCAEASIERDGARVLVRSAAGLPWDDLVARSVALRLAGLECLSGIPGRVGAAPIQNIGAYGQEVAERIVAVEATSLRDGRSRRFAPSECGFGYRDSRFKGEWTGGWIVTAVEFALEPGGHPALRYAELAARAAALPGEPDPASVRDLVLSIRRAKSMVLDPADPDTRSAGSFFLNPHVDAVGLATVVSAVERAGIDPAGMPAWPQPSGRVRLSAAWLIERSGTRRGELLGGAAISGSHVLAIVNRGGGSASVLALAGLVRRRVRDRFGVTLEPEPVFVGFDRGPDDLLG